MALRDNLDGDWARIDRSLEYYYLIPILLIACSVFLRLFSRRKLRLPPGPTGLPLVGYLPFLGKEPFRVLHSLCKKYGNVYSLYLGRTYVVILGDYTAVKEAFSQNTTNDRPPRLFDFLPGSRKSLASVNGAEWTEQRRFTVKCMKDIGLYRTTWSSLVEDEVSDFLKELAQKKGDPIDINHSLVSSMASNVAAFIFGKRLPPGSERDTLNAAIDKVMSFFAQSSIWNYFPWLCKIFVKLKITNYYKRFCEMSTFHKLIRKQIDMHRQSHSGLNKGTNYISAYVEAMNNPTEGKKTTISEQNLIGNTQTLYLAGADTSSGSVIWLLLAMATYPEVQEKVHRELDSTLEKNQRALWEDRAKFPYTYATIMEGQRWKTIAPINPLRAASEDMTICGYDIPKGTPIMANNWGLHNDTRYWTETEEFIPERFLQNEGKEVILKPESYGPFSHGKRKCPAENVALNEIFLYFTGIMQMFEVRAPNGRKPSLDAELGLNYHAVPQELCYLPR